MSQGKTKRKRRGIAGSKDAETGSGPATDEAGEEKGGWGETLRTIAWSIVLFLILRTFILQTFFITSGSMKDTMLIGDFLVVNKAAVGSTVPFTGMRIPGYSTRRHGDILIFDPPHTDSLKLVKRLVGLPGDVLEMRDKALYRNGERVDEPYVRHVDLPDSGTPEMMWQLSYLAPDVEARGYAPTRDTWGPIVIPEDNYFFLGDNREESLDSRYWGLVRGDKLEGRAAFIYFSYDRTSYKSFPAITAARWGRIFNVYR
jgi:signal peptidase I